jgi:Tfp pilus assembly protein PilV
MRVVPSVRGERGMTVVEVLVAAVVLLAGVLAAFSVLVGSRDLTTTAERLEAATHIAERELESMQALRWVNLAHPTAPASGPPPHTVSLSAGVWRYQWRAGNHEQVAIDATNGQVPAAAATVDDGRINVTVWRYVSWVDDATVAGTTDYKRLTVVVRVNEPGSMNRLTVLTTYAARKEGF